MTELCPNEMQTDRTTSTDRENQLDESWQRRENRAIESAKGQNEMNTQAQLAQQIEAQTAAHRQSLQHFITGCESRVIGATPVDNSQYAYEQAKNEACGDHDQLTDWLCAMSMEQTQSGKQVRAPGWSTMLEDLSVPDLLVALMQCDDKALPAIRMTLRDKYAAEHAQQIVSRANEIESDMAQEDFE